MHGWLPILIMIGFGAGFGAVNVALGKLLGPKRPTAEKLAPYECGMPPVGDAHEAGGMSEAMAVTGTTVDRSRGWAAYGQAWTRTPGSALYLLLVFPLAIAGIAVLTMGLTIAPWTSADQ